MSDLRKFENVEIKDCTLTDSSINTLHNARVTILSGPQINEQLDVLLNYFAEQRD